MTDKPNAIVATEPQAVTRADPFAIDEQLVRDTICRGATDQEFVLFVAIAKRLRLDPLARQIFAVKRWDSQLKREVMTAQLSIDAFRLTAQRTGQYRGQTEPQWCGQTSGPEDEPVWLSAWLGSKPPAAARCGVWREGFKGPLYAVARYASYVQTKKDGQPNKFWSTMPDVMLSKVAEALALRKAFPNELSDAYTVDEMGQAENDAPETIAYEFPEHVTHDVQPEAMSWATPDPPHVPDQVTTPQLARLSSLVADPRLKLETRQAIRERLKAGRFTKTSAGVVILKAKSAVAEVTGAPYVAFEDTNAADREPEDDEPPIDAPPDLVPEFPASVSTHGDAFEGLPAGQAKPEPKPPVSAGGTMADVMARAEARGRSEPEAQPGQQSLDGARRSPRDYE